MQQRLGAAHSGHGQLEQPSPKTNDSHAPDTQTWSTAQKFPQPPQSIGLLCIVAGVTQLWLDGAHPMAEGDCSVQSVAEQAPSKQ